MFLNSGDWLENDILARVFKENFTEDIVYADLYQYRNADDIQISPYPDKLTLPFIYNYSLGHPSTLLKENSLKICYMKKNTELYQIGLFYNTDPFV